MSRSDLALDTIAVGGMTTALDTLYAGVPMLALRGERMNNRFGSSALSALYGVDNLGGSGGDTMREYEDAAIRLLAEREEPIYTRG